MKALVPRHRCTGPFDRTSHLCDACQVQPAGAVLPCARLVAESPTMRDVLRRAAPMATSNAPVVLLGETGTGKEVMARALHDNGPRAGRAFVAVNCGAMPGELIESELFGHVRGAFSGAYADKRGLFEEANEGTILLDEIADLPLRAQVKLLRVLQDGEVRRVGATHAVDVDVRVMAATHLDFSGLVEKGAFREDLYYRLKVFSLRLPPLRERREDILPIAREFLAQLPGLATRFSQEAVRVLVGHRWPGNVRELANAVRHAAALARSACIEVDDLPEDIVARDPTLTAVTPAPSAAGRVQMTGPVPALESLAEVERRHVLAVVEACHGNQTEAARVLGIARNTLWRKLENYHRGDAFSAASGSDAH